MSITLIEASEVVSGLTITGQISPNAVRTEILFSPYDELIALYKSGVTEPEELIEKMGLGVVQASLESIKNMNGLSKANWLEILEHAFVQHNVGARLEKAGRKLQRGEEVDPTEIRHLVNLFGKEKSGRFSLSESKSEEVPFIKTGFSPA